MTPTRLLLASALAFSVGHSLRAQEQQPQTDDQVRPWRSNTTRSGGASQTRANRIIRVISEQRDTGITPIGAPGTGTNDTGGTTGTLPGGITPIGSPNLNPTQGGAARRLSASGVLPPPNERRAGASRFVLRAGLRTPVNFDVESSESQVSISWDDATANESGFVVQRASREGNTWSDPVELRVNANTQALTDEPGEGLWAYRVAAMSSQGRSWYTPWKVVAAQEAAAGTQTPPAGGSVGDTGNGTQPPTIPSAPATLAATDAGNRTASVTWAASASSSLRGYEIERTPAFPVGTIKVGPSITSYADATGAGSFSYRVRANGSAGNSDFTAWASVAVSDIAPSAPTQLATHDLGDHDRVRLTWTDTSDNESRFLLQRETRNSSGAFASLQSMIVSPNTSEQVDNPGPGEHRYRIAAANGAGQSAATDWVNITIEPQAPTDTAGEVPAAPSGLIISDAGNRTATVRWTDASANEDAFEVERNPAFPGGRVRVQANQMTLSDACGVGQFWYRVRAVNASGGSAFTDWVNVTVADTAPEAPSALAVTDDGDHTTATIRWSDNSDNESSFRVEHQQQSSGGWGSTRVIQTLANAAQQADQPGPGTHRYRVAAVNSAGASAFTPWATLTIEQAPVDPSTLPPSAPSGVMASDQGNRRAGLAWNDTSTNESGFQVERAPAFPGGLVTLGADVTAYLDTSGAGSFSYRVRSFNNAGYSAWSDWAGVNIAETMPSPPLDFSATDAGDQTRVMLRWTDASFNEQGFRVERSTWNDGQWQPVSPLLLSANSSTTIDAPGLGRHRYRIQSFNSGGDSAPTDWAVVNVTDGWTPVVASPDTQVFYVSSSTGNDSNDGRTEATAKRSLGAGFSLLRRDQPDHLRLKRGDVWVNEHIGDFSGGVVGAFNKSGRSATEPMVVYTYGDSPNRPLVKSGSRPFGLHMQSGGGMNNVWIMGIGFQANTKVPNTPDFNPTVGGNKGVSYYSSGGNILLEDLKIEYYGVNIDFTAASVTSPLRNIVVRRCVVVDAYSTGSHSQGMYTEAVDGMLVDECVFDHNGWHATVPEAESTIFNHNFYLNKTGKNLTVRNTITARGAATGIQMRGNPMHSINNLSLANPLGITMGHGSIPYPTEFSSGSMMYNVVLDSADIGLGVANGLQMQPRGFGLTWGRSKNVTAVGNIVAHNTSAHGDEPGLATDDQNDNVLAEDNIVYNWRGANGTGVAFRVQVAQPSNALHRDNVFMQPNGGRCVLSGVATPGGQWSDNAYYSTDPSTNGWFRHLTNALTPAEWATRTGDSTAQMSQVSFPEPGRTIGTYMASLGFEPTLEAFLTEARKQSRTNWRPEFTAQAVNQYIREGFGMPEPTQGVLAGAGQ
ncbi:MAG TPA: fibronectin type III domain-containing protein [Phycisphaerales bacterium]|nr:fibronectin type III domain-containing protein [Phycisphaerales bacterium]